MQYQNTVFNHIYLSETGRRYRSLKKIVQPTVEPVTLAELKLQCRVDHDAEDSLLAGLIQGAREYAELRLDRCLIDTRLEMKLDTFPASLELPLPLPPFSQTADKQQIEVRFLNVQLQELTVTEAQPVIVSMPGTFLANRAATPAVLTPNVNGYWPVTGPLRSAVTIRWWAGYGASGADVPRGIRHAVLALAAHWYLNREAVSTSGLAKVPMLVDELLAAHTWGSYA